MISSVKRTQNYPKTAYIRQLARKKSQLYLAIILLFLY